MTAPAFQRTPTGGVSAGLNLRGVIEGVGELTDRFLQATASEIANEVIVGGTYSPGTPVDKGFLRGNWDAAVNGDPAGGESEDPVARVEEAITGFRVGERLVMANSAPYAATVELGGYPNPPKLGTRVAEAAGFTRYEIRSVGGFSYQAPQGMVGLALAAAPQIAEQVAAAIRAEGA